jgi:hypothetical protein
MPGGGVRFREVAMLSAAMVSPAEQPSGIEGKADDDVWSFCIR